MNRRIVSTLLLAARSGRRSIRTVAPGEHAVLQHGEAAAAASATVKQRAMRTYSEGVWEHESLREPMPPGRQASAPGPLPRSAAASGPAGGPSSSAAAQDDDSFALSEEHGEFAGASPAATQSVPQPQQRRWTAATGVKPGSPGPIISPPIGARRFATRAGINNTAAGGAGKAGPSGFDVSESAGYDAPATEALKSAGSSVKKQASATAERVAYKAANAADSLGAKAANAADNMGAKAANAADNMGAKAANAADNMGAKASSATSRAANTAADAAEKLGAKAGAALGGAATELRKPAEDIAADAAAAVTRGAKRAGAAVSEAVRESAAPQGSRMTDGIPSATGEGEATLREELEATAEYPFESGVTPPSYLQGGRPGEGRDMNAELPADLEEAAGFYAESGMTAPSSVGLDVPLDGDPQLKKMAGVVRTGQLPRD